ncbi:MAG: two-component system response regulator [Deltaproteobacteria bacterium RIFOXYA12_FULL_58_15]|nr:MAG: two-component system response regulator [Deltaproteobacteria bacterium RIFOXYA12_FULL_58_15]OGR11247.1 MAG: two-component system response regulator [Deltaproteobacteria bacterium RIFOXYB12_FULL_58_9]
MPRLMVVEDSAAMRGMIASILGQIADSEVVEVASGFEALKLLPRDVVDLIVMDINMPDINGLELLSFVRKLPAYANTPVLIVTTERGEEDRKRGMALGANGYLVKPFDPDELLETVINLLSERS